MGDRIEFRGTVRDWLRERYMAWRTAPRYRPIQPLYMDDPEYTAIRVFLRTDILGDPAISEPASV